MGHTYKRTTEDYAEHFQRLNIKNKPLNFGEAANPEWIKSKEVSFGTDSQNASVSNDQKEGFSFPSVAL